MLLTILWAPAILAQGIPESSPLPDDSFSNTPISPAPLLYEPFPPLPPAQPPPANPPAHPPFAPGSVSTCVMSSQGTNKCGLLGNTVLGLYQSELCIQYKSTYPGEDPEYSYLPLLRLPNWISVESLNIIPATSMIPSIPWAEVSSELIKIEELSFNCSDCIPLGKEGLLEMAQANMNYNTRCEYEVFVCRGNLCNMPNLLTHPPNAPPVQNAPPPPNAPPSPSTMPYIVAIVALSVVVLLTACWCVWQRCDIVAQETQETPQTTSAA